MRSVGLENSKATGEKNGKRRWGGTREKKIMNSLKRWHKKKKSWTEMMKNILDRDPWRSSYFPGWNFMAVMKIMTHEMFMCAACTVSFITYTFLSLSPAPGDLSTKLSYKDKHELKKRLN